MDALWLQRSMQNLHTIKTQKLKVIKIFCKHSKDVGMAQKVQKQVKAVNQLSINHRLHIQGLKTIRCDILACRTMVNAPLFRIAAFTYFCTLYHPYSLTVIVEYVY